MAWHHVSPVNDLIDHNLERFDCPCGPEIDFENEIVIHAAMDRRECFEEHINKKELTMETNVRVKGHTKNLKAWLSECGGEVGIAFMFDGESPWVIPYVELKRLADLCPPPDLSVQGKAGKAGKGD